LHHAYASAWSETRLQEAVKQVIDKSEGVKFERRGDLYASAESGERFLVDQNGNEQLPTYSFR
jgi:hypothetical protein